MVFLDTFGFQFKNTNLTSWDISLRSVTYDFVLLVSYIFHVFQAIYCYSTDGRGPCYAVEGRKICLQWFRTYLIIVSRDKTSDSLVTVLPTDTSVFQQIVLFSMYHYFIININLKFLSARREPVGAEKMNQISSLSLIFRINLSCSLL